MKTALIDASSAILLYKADLFDAVSSAYHLVMAPAVFQEVTVAGRQGAAHFDEVCRWGQIRIASGPIGPYGEEKLSGMGAGERETLCMYDKGGVDFVILDDRKGASYCRSQTIPYINALLCPKILHWAGMIDGSAYIQALEHLLDQGRYSRQVVEFEIKCNHQELAFFMPDGV